MDAKKLQECIQNDYNHEMNVYNHYVCLWQHVHLGGKRKKKYCALNNLLSVYSGSLHTIPETSLSPFYDMLFSRIYFDKKKQVKLSKCSP